MFAANINVSHTRDPQIGRFETTYSAFDCRTSHFNYRFALSVDVVFNVCFNFKLKSLAHNQGCINHEEEAILFSVNFSFS